ncbi:MAG: hypothetical protein ACOCYT_03280 [Chloroflexota bacterium]
MLLFPKTILSVPPILVFAFFFLPWVAVSCGGDAMTDVSGEGMTFAMEGFDTDLMVASGLDLALGQLSLTSDARALFSGSVALFGGEASSDVEASLNEVEAQLDTVEGDYELFLIPGLALFALAVLFVSDQLLKGLYAGSAVAALVVMVLYYLELEADVAAEAGSGLRYEPGWWLTGGALVVMLLLGLIYRNRVAR